MDAAKVIFYKWYLAKKLQQRMKNILWITYLVYINHCAHWVISFKHHTRTPCNYHSHHGTCEKSNLHNGIIAIAPSTFILRASNCNASILFDSFHWNHRYYILKPCFLNWSLYMKEKTRQMRELCIKVSFWRFFFKETTLKSLINGEELINGEGGTFREF